MMAAPCDTPAAAAFRAGMPPADLAAYGVRPAGPLNWSPVDPEPGQREPAVSLARRRQLTRERLARQERRRRQLREVGRYWQGAA